jgi:hypothetical protein
MAMMSGERRKDVQTFVRASANKGLDSTEGCDGHTIVVLAPDVNSCR